MLENTPLTPLKGGIIGCSDFSNALLEAKAGRVEERKKNPEVEVCSRLIPDLPFEEVLHEFRTPSHRKIAPHGAGNLNGKHDKIISRKVKPQNRAAGFAVAAEFQNQKS